MYAHAYMVGTLSADLFVGMHRHFSDVSPLFLLAAGASVGALAWHFVSQWLLPHAFEGPGCPSDCAGDGECIHHWRKEAAAERAGRARAQKAMREMVNGQYGKGEGGQGQGGPVTRGYDALPIATVESAFRRRSGAPRQGMLAPDARAHVLFAPAIPAKALVGLQDYTHVFLLFLFHENTDAHKQAGSRAGRHKSAPHAEAAVPAEGGSTSAVDNGALQARPFQAMIEAPALGGEKTGVFSTRSPHRPNAIGLSLVRLVSVHGADGGKGGARMLVVSGCDLVHGTPILDVKPYAPYDCPTCMRGLLTRQAATTCACSSASTASSGSPVGAKSVAAAFTPPRTLQAAKATLSACADMSEDAFKLHGPDWSYATLADLAASRLPVVWGEGTVEAVTGAVASGQTKFYGQASIGGGKVEEECSALLRALTQVLALDIRAVHQGRGGAARGRGAGGAAGWNHGGQAQEQEYELFFDTLHVQFTFRAMEEGPKRVFVHIHAVSVVPPT